MSIAEMMLPEWDQEIANTRKLLVLVPDDKMDYKPHEKSMALGRLASHIAEMATTWATTTCKVSLLEMQPGMLPYIAKSRDELVEFFDKGIAEAREAIAGTSDEAMAENWTLKFGDKVVFSMPRAATLRSMVFNHIIHHRAQLGVYLRLNEIEIPGMYGPSADEMKYWAPPAATA